MRGLQLAHEVSIISSDEAYGFYGAQKTKVDPRNKPCVCYGIRVDNQIVAAALLFEQARMARHWNIKKPANLIAAVYVDPRYRSRGYARSVVNHISKYRSCVLSVYRENEHAVNLYSDLGFDKHIDLPDDRIVMQKEYASSNEGYGYIEVSIVEEQAQQISDLLADRGITDLISPDEMHVTLMYDRANIVMDHNPSSRYHMANVTGITTMGEPGTKWYAVVLELESPSLLKRHGDLKRLGFTHSYSEYLPHMSVKYRPTDFDVEQAKELLEAIQGLGPLRFERETWKSTND